LNDNKLFTEAPYVHIIAGHQFTLPYRVIREDGGTVDLSLNNTVIKWILTDWDMPNSPILTLTNATSAVSVSTPTSDFNVNLSASDTTNFNGQYKYQIEITSPLGDVFRPIEGNLIFEPRNYETT
jgi:hypothetical protein